MLDLAREKAVNRRHSLPVFAADALTLPIPDASVDVVTVAFGVRNFSDLEAGLSELVRVLRSGGLLVVLEFSHPDGPLGPLLEWWVRTVPPRIGRVLSGDPEASSYLPASVNSFADSEEMCRRLVEAGLDDVRARPLTGGVASLYEGTRRDGNDATDGEGL